jgi:LysM repeat protein
MENTLLFSISIFFLANFLIAQDFSFPKGVYMSFEEILKKNLQIQQGLKLLKEAILT